MASRNHIDLNVVPFKCSGAEQHIEFDMLQDVPPQDKTVLILCLFIKEVKVCMECTLGGELRELHFLHAYLSLSLERSGLGFPPRTFPFSRFCIVSRYETSVH